MRSPPARTPELSRRWSIRTQSVRARDPMEARNLMEHPLPGDESARAAVREDGDSMRVRPRLTGCGEGGRSARLFRARLLACHLR